MTGERLKPKGGAAQSLSRPPPVGPGWTRERPYLLWQVRQRALLAFDITRSFAMFGVLWTS